MLQGSHLVPPSLLHRLHDTRLESANVVLDAWPVNSRPRRILVQDCTSLRRHLLILLGRFATLSRDEQPRGSLPAFASGDISTRIPAITTGHSLAPPSSIRIAIARPCGLASPRGAIRTYHVPHA